tara:strand:+ start:1088 stop:1405 length:318 start_codon:yes stop_codon:yes gene_type:complete
MEDVYDELIRLYDRSHNNKMTARLGESLYLSAGYFVDYSRLIDDKVQMNIKKYIYSKVSRTPPYVSIQDTPADFIDSFIIIDEEAKICTESDTSASTEPKIKGKK